MIFFCRNVILYPTLCTYFDTFWYFYDKPASQKDSHRIWEIWSCELRFYFPLVFFPVHLKLLTQCRDHAGLRNKYRKSEIRNAECRLYKSDSKLHDSEGSMQLRYIVSCEPFLTLCKTFRKPVHL